MYNKKTTLIDIKYSDLKRDIEIAPSRAGYNYIKLYLKNTNIIPKKHEDKFEIIYLSKGSKNVVHLRNCRLALTEPSEDMYSFMYSVDSRDSFDFKKTDYLKLKLKTYLKCY